MVRWINPFPNKINKINLKKKIISINTMAISWGEKKIVKNDI